MGLNMNLRCPSQLSKLFFTPVLRKSHLKFYFQNCTSYTRNFVTKVVTKDFSVVKFSVDFISGVYFVKFWNPIGQFDTFVEVPHFHYFFGAILQSKNLLSWNAQSYFNPTFIELEMNSTFQKYLTSYPTMRAACGNWA